MWCRFRACQCSSNPRPFERRSELFPGECHVHQPPLHSARSGEHARTLPPSTALRGVWPRALLVVGVSEPSRRGEGRAYATFATVVGLGLPPLPKFERCAGCTRRICARFWCRPPPSRRRADAGEREGEAGFAVAHTSGSVHDGHLDPAVGRPAHSVASERSGRDPPCPCVRTRWLPVAMRLRAVHSSRCALEAEWPGDQRARPLDPGVAVAAQGAHCDQLAAQAAQEAPAPIGQVGRVACERAARGSMCSTSSSARVCTVAWRAPPLVIPTARARGRRRRPACAPATAARTRSGAA